MNNAQTHNSSVNQQQKGTHAAFAMLAIRLIALVLFCNTAAAINSPVKADAASQARLVETFGKLPLSFEINQGQTDKQTLFLSRGSGYSLFLSPTGAVLTLHKSEPAKTKASKLAGPALSTSAKKPPTNAVQNSQDKAATLRMNLVGGNLSLKITGLDELPGKVNYFRGKDSKQWQTNIPTYAKVKYEKVYPGIDLIYYGNQRQLEYDFIVAPEADPKAVWLAFDGADKLTIDKQGDLVLKSAGDEVRLRKPRIYQDINGQQHEIEGWYVLNPAKSHGQSKVGFEVAAYDKSKPLVIDPVLEYSTYLGGSGNLDRGNSIAVDNNGNVYVTGHTSSIDDFPTQNPVPGGSACACTGAGDVFITKFDPSGTALVYSTYLGGSNSDEGRGIAVDSNGNVYVTGTTTSTNFPTRLPIQATNGGGFDAFVVKLNAAGNALVYSTYLGGSRWDSGNGIALDTTGNAYVTGVAQSSESDVHKFPITPGAFDETWNGQGTSLPFGDAFVTKINASGTAWTYSTYLGGSGNDEGRGIAVDINGNAYVTGLTYSGNFPTQNPIPGTTGTGSPDAFVTKINAAGNAPLIYSTYLGGDGLDQGNGIAIDTLGNAYVTGTTRSTNFPPKNPLQGPGGWDDAFVSKFNASGTALIYSTYLGGSSGDGDRGLGIGVDAAGNAYVIGETWSDDDFPLQNPIQDVRAGRSDVFVTKFNATGMALIYSTYLGGGNDDVYQDDRRLGIAVDAAGSAYITGGTSSIDFPLVNAFQQNTADGFGYDAFVAKISDAAPPPLQPVLSVTPPPSLDFGSVTLNAYGEITFTVQNSGTGTLTGTASTSPPFSVTSGASFSLNAGASQPLVVRFSPTTTGNFFGNINFTSNGGSTSPLVTGIGISDTVSQDIPQQDAPNLQPPPDVSTSSGNLSPNNTNDFDINKPTVVITHGWNPFGASATPEWMMKMAKAIGDKANVFLWNWQDKAKTHDETICQFLPTACIPYDWVEQSGKDLARALEMKLCDQPDSGCSGAAPKYVGKIHFIGHSLGSGVVTYAAKYFDKYKNNLDHLTLLDSPYFFWEPGGTILSDIKDRTFVDNYWSIVGKIYSNADVNVLLPNLPFIPKDCIPPLSLLTEPHGFSHEWYYSSYQDFYCNSLLNDLTVPPTPPNYGSYWARERGDSYSNNRAAAAWFYSSISFFDKWNLYVVSRKPVSATSLVEFLGNAEISLAQAAKDQIIDYAQKTSTAIKVVAVNTYNAASDVGNYFVDVANHAVWKLQNRVNGFFELSLNSAAVLHSDIDVPIDANAMRFSFEFVSADNGGVLEVFLDDNRVYAALSKDYVGHGQQNADWIDVSQFAGKHMKLSYRLSNAIEGRHGVVALDDLIFAHIDSALAPIANAGPDQTANTGIKITLNGSGSQDPDNAPAPLTYSWTQTGGPSVTLTGKTAATPSFTPLTPGTYVFSLVVNDGAASSTADSVTITVSGTVNVAPIANASPDQAINAGTKVTLNGSGSHDPDNGPAPLTYSWTQTEGPSVSLTGATTATPSFTPLTPGTYVFSLTVNDGAANSTADSVTITVNDAAYLLIQAPNGGEVWNEKTKQTLSWISRNIDGNKRLLLSISIDNGLNWKKIVSPKNVGSKIWKIPKNRYVSKLALLKICVKQSEPLCDTSDAVFTINKAPVAEAGVKQTVIVGTEVVLDGGASFDADGGPSSLTYQWTQKSGPLVTLNGPDTATPGFTPTDKGLYRFGLIVNDGSADSKQDKVMVKVKAAP